MRMIKNTSVKSTWKSCASTEARMTLGSLLNHTRLVILWAFYRDILSRLHRIRLGNKQSFITLLNRFWFWQQLTISNTAETKQERLWRLCKFLIQKCFKSTRLLCVLKDNIRFNKGIWLYECIYQVKKTAPF